MADLNCRLAWHRDARSPSLLEVYMQAHNCFFMVLLSLTLPLANVARAQPEYRVTVMAPANSVANDINNAGVVVGTSNGRAFLNRGKGMVDLGTLDGRFSTAEAINDKGEVLGHWDYGGWRGFIYYRGKQRDIGALPERSTFFRDINNAGYVIASGKYRGRYELTQSFLRSPDGQFTNIGFLPHVEASDFAEARALNNSNQITGHSGTVSPRPPYPFRAFIWTKGAMRDLGDPRFALSTGVAINERGQVTGFYTRTGYGQDRAFLYSKGRTIDIDDRPDPKGQFFSAGAGINNRGHIVGIIDNSAGFVFRGKRMEKLNALIDPKLGWDIFSARAINDAGQIAATARRNEKTYAVRLDLIRPNAEGMPALELDEATARSTMSPEEAEADARAEAEAQAREVVRPVGVDE